MKKPTKLSEIWSIDKSWTLFLDRDGVINQRLQHDYVKKVEEFQILPGVLEAIERASEIFGRIIVVTNQQGIGKGLMTIQDLAAIHDYLIKQVAKSGGKIDAIYFSPHLTSENSPMRKPEIGMAHLARLDFPEIDFTKSIMAGDSLSDIEFGKNTGTKTVFIESEISPAAAQLADVCFPNLALFVKEI
jgi:histidinol-phosphate phosphatase family protein